MPFIPHWSLRTVKNRKQVCLVELLSLVLGGLCLQIPLSHLPPQQGSGPGRDSPPFPLPSVHGPYWSVVLPCDKQMFRPCKIRLFGTTFPSTNYIGRIDITRHKYSYILCFKKSGFILKNDKKLSGKSLDIALCLLIFRILKDLK